MIESSQSNGVMDIERTVFQRDFNRRPFQFTHSLADRPMFSLEHLAEVSKTLKANYFQSSDLTAEQGFRMEGRQAKSAQEAIQQIEELNSWVILKKVDQFAEFRDLLAQTIATASQVAGYDLGHGAKKLEAFVFVTSPGGVAPYHIDAEATFLFQIHGRKTCYLFDQTDRTILTQPEIEQFYRGDENASQYRSEIQEKARVFELLPGQGVHLPVLAPHWLENRDDVSVTFTVSFIPPESNAAAKIHFTNHFLRKWGMSPREPGQSTAGDPVKSAVGSAAFGLRSVKRLASECLRKK